MGKNQRMSKKRDHIQLAQLILGKIQEQGGNGARKREFMKQLRNFVKDTKYYPPEACYPWDKLGHICREYCSAFGQGRVHDWQATTLDILGGDYDEKDR